MFEFRYGWEPWALILLVVGILFAFAVRKGWILRRSEQRFKATKDIQGAGQKVAADFRQPIDKVERSVLIFIGALCLIVVAFHWEEVKGWIEISETEKMVLTFLGAMILCGFVAFYLLRRLLRGLDAEERKRVAGRKKRSDKRKRERRQREEKWSERIGKE